MEVLQEGLIPPPEEKARTVLGHTKNFKDEEKEVSLTVTGQKHVWYVPNFRGYTIVQYTPGKVVARTFLNNRCRASLTVILTDGRVSFHVFTRTGKDKRIRSSYHAISDFVQHTRILLSGKKLTRNSMRKHNSIPMLEVCLSHAMAHLFREQNPKRVVRFSGRSVNRLNISGQELLRLMAFPNVQNPLINMNKNHKIRALREQRLSAISKRLLGFAGNQANSIMTEILSSIEGVGVGFIETLKVLKKLGWEKDHLMKLIKTPMMHSLFSSTSAQSDITGVLKQLGPQKAIRFFSLGSNRYDMHTLTDTFRLQNQVENAGFEIAIPQEIKSIKELHDFYSYIVNRNRQNNYKLFVHPEFAEYDGATLTIPADEPTGVNADGSPIYQMEKSDPYGPTPTPYTGATYTIRFPKEDNTLREWGQSLSICVGGYGNVVHTGQTIVFALYQEDDLYACIDINGTDFHIRQANTRFNRRIPEKEIKAIAELMGVVSQRPYSYRPDPSDFTPKKVKKYKSMVDYGRVKEPVVASDEEDMGSVVAREALHHILRQRRNQEQDNDPYGYRRGAVANAVHGPLVSYTAEEIFELIIKADYPGKPKSTKVKEVSPEFMPLRKLFEANVEPGERINADLVT